MPRASTSWSASTDRRNKTRKAPVCRCFQPADTPKSCHLERRRSRSRKIFPGVLPCSISHRLSFVHLFHKGARIKGGMLLPPGFPGGFLFSQILQLSMLAYILSSNSSQILSRQDSHKWHTVLGFEYCLLKSTVVIFFLRCSSPHMAQRAHHLSAATQSRSSSYNPI